MWCNQIFSLIAKNEETNINVVVNTIVCDNYETANFIARECFGENAIAVDTTLIPVAIGDIYKDGNFYREDVLIPRNPTEAERITAILARIDENELEKAETDLDIEERLCYLELGI